MRLGSGRRQRARPRSLPQGIGRGRSRLEASPPQLDAIDVIDVMKKRLGEEDRER
jgi:hypothetical protein